MQTFVRLGQQGKSPIDFLAYRVAADALAQGKSPYLTPDQSLQIWRSFHEKEVDLLRASARGEGQEMLRELEARPQQPGPYLYPPSLALLISQLHISAFAFAGLTLLSILGFAWLWLRSTGANSIWLLLVIFSLDVLASLNAGNVELVLLCTTLLAARLLWDQRAVFAAPLIAIVVLIKPFYVLFFMALAVLQLSSHPAAIRRTLRSLAISAVIALALITLEVYRWGPQLGMATLQYLLHALDYQWFVLPVAEQTPMSAWNRTPMQALVNAGVPATLAQWGTFGLWIVLLALTLWRVREVPLTFPLAFALSLILLYWGRPVGWTLIYLEFVVVVAVWPSVRRWQRVLLICAVLALMLSHWWALVLTARGYGMPLVTLQSAAFPWETWLVLPLSWLLLVRALAVQTAASSLPARSMVRSGSAGSSQ